MANAKRALHPELLQEGNIWMRHGTISRGKSLVYISALACLLQGCGGEGSTSSVPFVVVTPTPTAAPSPAPTPSPTPASTTSGNPALGGARVGDTIAGMLACSDGRVSRAADGRVTGISAITRMKIDNGVAITYRGPDSFTTDINGFGGSSWTFEDKRTPPSDRFTRYSNTSQGELLVTTDELRFVTYGQENGSGLCFFAAGLSPFSLRTAGTFEYFGVVDGLGIIGGVPKRFLYNQVNSSEPEFVMDFATGQGKLKFDLVAKSNVFEDLGGGTSERLGTVEADLRLAPGSTSFAATPLSGSGFTGTVRGFFVSNAENIMGSGGAGVALVFELRNSNGDLIYGSVALAANLM